MLPLAINFVVIFKSITLCIDIHPWNSADGIDSWNGMSVIISSIFDEFVSSILINFKSFECNL